ncbi:adenosine receptor A2b [Cephus cinctus]|uniref:Adenosine receptor A2b n=1 Tax=Cephus cinctus TaxID=211228 RepID=A0AAJ7C6S5_CEPCN|nr:adenosine receptor A2b [Cephus cinctus]
MEYLNTTELDNYCDYTVPLNTTYDSYSIADLNVVYAVCEILVAVCAVFGNGLVILVFARERKLRRRTNYYIISLATADLLVGLFAIPFAILASIGLPTNLHACLFTVSVLVVLCTISIFCLVAVSVDRYWAILHPMGYSRTVRTKTAIGIICVCWVAGTLVGFLPLLGWNAGKKSDEKCIFTEVMDYDYLVFLYFATIIFPALLIAAFYAHIYRVVLKQLQQIVTMNPGRHTENQTTGTMLRLLGAAQKREVKATQNLSRIVIFFIICWFPLYTINCVEAFCPDCKVNDVFLNFCIILSHLNSVGNPLLYAYHLKDFRAALKNFMYKLLFPNSDIKASVVSVVHERPSVGSQHNVHQVSLPLSFGGYKPTMQRISDIRNAATSVSRNSTICRREDANAATESSPSDLSDRQKIKASNVSTNSSEFNQNENLTTNIQSDCGTSGPVTPSKPSPSMELQIYRAPFGQLLQERIEGNPSTGGDTSSESVFVIEADINRTASSRERLTSEQITQDDENERED